MNEVASPSTPPRPNSASPPPKCAICLGTCTNKCFSDSCMHQFCFTCLLEWSKVKAECPLCKQPFKSIIHNIKSNDEYDEHFIATQVPEAPGILDNDDEFLYLPPAPSRHFQFRTTFTVDPGGELAIQQMLLSHPLTHTMYNVPGNYILPRQRYGRPRHTRRASSATSFRRSIYLLNMWVYAPPDVTGRYRDISPHFYRENPAARNRLVPWLNRELNALLRENTQQVMHLVDVIMDHLMRWHIRSRSFKDLLNPYLTNKTAHFIHEFYNFMRSPYDMIGYDRHIVYTDRPYSPTYSISDHDDDSDVAIVNISEPVAANNNPFRRPTIEVIEITSDSSHDSDVIIGETPAPEIVNLVDSDTTDVGTRTPEPVNNMSEDTEESEVNRKPILPLKIRLKHKRQSREKRSRNKKCCSKRYHSSTSRSSSTSSDSSESSTSSGSSHKRYKRRHKYKKLKRSHKEYKLRNKEKSKIHVKSPTFISDLSSSDDKSCLSIKKKVEFDISDSSSSDDKSLLSIKKKVEFDTDDNIPLSKIKNKDKKKKTKKSRQGSQASSSKTHTITSRNSPSTGEEATTQNTNDDEETKPSCSRWKPEVGNSSSFENVNSSFTSVNSSLPSSALPSLSNGEYHFPDSVAHFKYEQYPPHVNSSQNGALPQFDNIPHYDTFQQYSQYHSCSQYPATVGNRYYDGPDYSLHRNSDSYSPPPAHNTTADGTSNVYNNLLYRNECHCGNTRECTNYSCSNNKLLNLFPQRNSADVPSRVHVSVGTSPIKNEVGEQDYGYYTVAGPSSSSSSRRLQSVIVKKEEKETPQLYRRCFLDADGTDSDN